EPRLRTPPHRADASGERDRGIRDRVGERRTGRIRDVAHVGTDAAYERRSAPRRHRRGDAPRPHADAAAEQHGDRRIGEPGHANHLRGSGRRPTRSMIRYATSETTAPTRISVMPDALAYAWAPSGRSDITTS